MVIDIQRALSRVEHAVKALEGTAKSHGERLDQLGKMQNALSILERANVFHGQRLGQLEKEIYAGKILCGIIAAVLGVTALVIYLVHHIAPLFAK